MCRLYVGEESWMAVMGIEEDRIDQVLIDCLASSTGLWMREMVSYCQSIG